MPISITIDAPTAAEIAALQAAANGLAGGAGTGTGTVGGGGTVTPPVAYFPTDPGSAPFPSPENSEALVLNGKVSGSPYLRSASGAIYQFATDASGNLVSASTVSGGVTVQGWQLNINGRPIMSAATLPAPMACFAMIVRQGGVYFQTSNSTGWGFSKTDGPSNWTIVALPAASGTVVVPPAMPADPVAMSPAPGSSGNVVLAGPSQTLKTLAAGVAAAKAGDTIRLDAGAVFAESVEITVPLLIDGQGKIANPGAANASFSGGAILDGSTFTAYALGKGGLVLAADVIVRGMEIRGFGLKETSTGGTAGIRSTGSAGHIFAVDNCYVHDNQDGVSEGGTPNLSDWTLTNSLFANNGIGDGLSHNIYVEGVHLTLSGVTSIVGPSVADATRATGLDNGGHALKTRSNALAISSTNYFAASDATPIDIPDGTTVPFSIAAGTTIHKSAADANHGVFDYCAESTLNGAAGGTVVATLDVQCASPFVNINAGTVAFAGSTRTGTAISSVGAGTVTGMP